MVISGSRESMNSEVAAMRNRSAEILRSIDHHRAIVDACGKMMEILNPEFAERQRQEAENKALREEISELKAMMAELLKPAERPSTNNSKNNKYDDDRDRRQQGRENVRLCRKMLKYGGKLMQCIEELSEGSGMGQRDDGYDDYDEYDDMGQRSGYGNRGGYGGGYGNRYGGGSMGQRRGVPGTGRYSRYR